MNPATQTLWLTVARLPGLGPRGRVALVEQFSSIEEIFTADRSTIEVALSDERVTSIERVDIAAARDAIRQGPDAAALTADVAWLNEEGHHLLTWSDADYPPLLREIPDPPLVLYVLGDRSVLAQPQIAIVGSRNPTPLGAQNAGAFAATLADDGLTITSGMALGIDGAAHRGALDVGGKTVAVTGTGLDRVYPARHRRLAHAIAAQGALVSQFPIGTPPRAENFPIRNRLISGLCLGVLVVEAALRSGSLITARLAAEQGREVFALPGSIHSPLARGCHALIRQGAKLVETAEHVLEELGPLARVTSPTPKVASRREVPDLAPLERRLFKCIDHDPAHMDALIDRSGLTADIVSSILLQLELRGLVLVGPGGYQRAS